MPRKTDKRIRLIEAAKVLIHQQGFNLTTLADIAQEADVPLGNVYYYFKTKEAIGIAVIEKRAAEWSERLASWSEISDPLARLVSMVRYGLEDLEITARFGCPVGGLCQELGKQGGALSDLAAKLLYDVLKWSEEQFRALGVEEPRAANHALHTLSGMQGMFLLTHTFKDPKIAQRQCDELQSWLEGIAKRKVEMPAVREEAVAHASSRVMQEEAFAE
ncbi:TetR/AcrR family transcriptional regulator [Candidatus Berkiella cookevillensis]|uniref:HTH-type transcriptional repressor NemR n=1 Tax=Candidatus Berkiella cookevillensis TaxID=437022 RepID=A0A0Q9YD06_9GAMM|nr:TetR/AcrR family transcriptional regulator [Candidatus Berkiella cookevillensis]MCS5708029.1 TetR/AcrR family transcriptional regulator [Candidatus Berkiella cookevillensis]